MRWILIVSLLAWVVITGMWRLLILLLVVGLAIVAATIAWRGRRRGASRRAGSYESNLPGDSSSGSALDFSHGSAALGSDSSDSTWDGGSGGDFGGAGASGDWSDASGGDFGGSDGGGGSD